MMKTTEVNDFTLVDMSEMKMPVYSVYKHPKDFPDKYVVRLFDLNQPTDIAVVKDTYGELLTIKPEHTAIIKSAPEDDPVIMEVWI